MICTFVAGSYAVPTTYLGPGRHLFGGAPLASVCCEDPLLDPHHLIFDVGIDGGIDIKALGSRSMPRLNGLALQTDGAGLTGRINARESGVLSVGSSTLRITSVFDQRLVALHSGSGVDFEMPVHAGPGHRQRVIREPRVAPVLPSTRCEAPVAPVLPSAPAPAHSLITAAVALVAGLTMALLLGHMMFAVFAGMGAFTAVATWGIGRIRHARLVRRARRTHRVTDREFVARLIAMAERIEAHLHSASTELCWPHVALRRGELWVRRPVHGDAYQVSLGLGDQRVELEVGLASGQGARPEQQRLVDQLSLFRSVPQTFALDGSAPMVVAVTGTVAAAVVRSMVMQLAVSTGPADLRIVAVSMDPQRYRWMAALPHTGEVAVIDARDPVQLGREIMCLDDGDARHVLLVTDAPELLTYRTAPVRRLLDLSRPITVIAQVAPAESRRGGDHVAAIPAACNTVITTDPLTSLGISDRVAAAMSAQLSGLEDPEDASLQANSIPTRVDLGSLTKGWESAEEIGLGWTEGGADPAPAAVIGRTADALMEIDLVADGPHGLVAGTTGSGKSELLRSLVISLAMRVSPVQLQFVLIDYKGGSTFDACCDLPHTVGLVTDLDEGLAERALISLEAELHRRERILRAASTADLKAYRARPEVAPLARLIVVIDEFAALAVELPGFLSALVGIAQRGRSLGVHLILATQRPAGVIDDAIRANTDLRIALRLNDAADARDVVGDDRPANFPAGCRAEA
jgi:DNA segregation ATPase FtsK/SpoIIIE, S-DNA-T family